MLTPCPSHKLEDRPLSALHYSLFNIYTLNLHIWKASLPSSTSEKWDLWPCGT